MRFFVGLHFLLEVHSLKIDFALRTLLPFNSGLIQNEFIHTNKAAFCSEPWGGKHIFGDWQQVICRILQLLLWLLFSGITKSSTILTEPYWTAITSVFYDLQDGIICLLLSKKFWKKFISKQKVSEPILKYPSYKYVFDLGPSLLVNHRTLVLSDPLRIPLPVVANMFTYRIFQTSVFWENSSKHMFTHINRIHEVTH